MKFTIVFIALSCVSTSWAVKAKKVEDPKDKREAPVSYGLPAFGSHSYQSPAAYSQGDANAISVGAGYSIGGSKPSYNFGGQSSSGSLHVPSEGLSPNGHATIQLPPITLQSGQGGYSASDLSQIMSQLSHSLGGGVSLQPSNAIAEFHQTNAVHGVSQGQEVSLPQFSYGAPKYELSNGPSYSSGTKGLSSYTSSTGPVLFTPSDSQPQSAAPAAPSYTYGAASSGQHGDGHSFSLGSSGHQLGQSFAAGQPFGSVFGDASPSLGTASNSLGSAGHSVGGPGLSLGGSGHSFSGSGHSLGGSSHSLSGLSLSGGSGSSFGGSPYKQFSGSYAAPSKNSFKPSAFLGSSVQNENIHGIPGLSGSYAGPSFSSYRGSNHGGLSGAPSSQGVSYHGPISNFGGSSKFIGPVYQSIKSDGLESASGVSSAHFASPPGSTYGIPGSSYSSNNAHAASSHRPYYINTKQYRSPHSQGSPSYRSPASSSSSFSGPKYSFSASNTHYDAHDAHGSASENSYNTIKYSEELKPRV